MAKVTWSKQAIENIHTTSEYYQAYSPGYANALIDRLFEKALLLESFPQSGRVVPEFNRLDVREVLYKPYRILYLLRTEDDIIILGIHHGAQLLTTAMLFG